MNSEIIFSVRESHEGGYEATAIGYSIFSEGDNYHQLIDNLKDAVKCHFNENDMPKLIRVHLVKDEVYAV